MNTKYNSSASGPVPRTLGRPVGVLPLGPRSALGLGQRRSGSIERRPLQKNVSTSSISSARSDLSNTSETSVANENGISRRLKKSELNKATQKSGRKQNISGSGIPPLNISERKTNLTTTHGRQRQQRMPIPVSSAHSSQHRTRDIPGSRQSAESDEENIFFNEQDVKFFDIPSASRPSTGMSSKSSVGHKEHKSLTTKDI
ncbi:hypothetical protein PoB_007512200, partial [Plakobranchus ocellatus]